MKIATRLMTAMAAATLGAVVISVIATTTLSQQKTQQALTDSVNAQFTAVARGREQALGLYLNSQRDLLLSLAANRLTQEALYGMERPFGSYRYEVTNPGDETLRSDLTSWYQQKYQPYAKQQNAEFQPDVSQWLKKSHTETLLLVLLLS